MEQSWHPESKTVSRKRLELVEIKNYLDEHYTERIVLDDLAERYYINKYYLTKIFKETYGSTINGYIIAKRITRAKQLLRFTDMTVDEIGNAVGMGDANYFSRTFRKVEGMPRTKGSKNRTKIDFDAQIAKLQKDKALLEEGVAKTVAQIEELKTDIKSMRESLKPQRAEIKQVEKEIAKLEAKKAKAEQKAAEEAKKAEAEAVVKKLLAGGMSADEILEKLK